MPFKNVILSLIFHLLIALMVYNLGANFGAVKSQEEILVSIINYSKLKPVKKVVKKPAPPKKPKIAPEPKKEVAKLEEKPKPEIVKKEESKENEKKPEEKKADLAKQEKPKEKELVQKKAENKPESKEEKIAKKDPEEKPEIQKAKKEPAKEKKPEENLVKKEEEPKLAKPKEEKQVEEQVVQKESEHEIAEIKEEHKKEEQIVPPSIQNFPELSDLNLTDREKFNISTQIRRCFQKALIKEGVDNLMQVSIDLTIDVNGFVSFDEKKNSDPLKDKSILRVVKNTIRYCNLIRNLPIDKYEVWNQIRVNFKNERDQATKQKLPNSG